MATFDYPPSLIPQAMSWGGDKAGVQHRSPFNGAVESVIFPGEFWRVSLTLPPARFASRRAAEAEAFFGRLAGGVDRVRLVNFLRPIPQGTMRGAPTVATSALRGAQTLLLSTPGSLMAGDFFKVGGQLLQAAFDCASDAGVLTVPLVQRLRAPVSSGAAVQWDHPYCLAIYPAMRFAAGYRPGVAEPITVELEEVPA